MRVRATGCEVEVPPTPAAKAVIEGFWRRDLKRNALREVRTRLLDERPAPGDAASMQEIYDQLCARVVDPYFLDAINDVLEHGLYAGLDAIRANLEEHLRVPAGADRDEVISLVVGTLQRHAGRAQRDVKAAVVAEAVDRP
jgi:hypothetical protein